jgi:hypothetical protein
LTSAGTPRRQYFPIDPRSFSSKYHDLERSHFNSPEASEYAALLTVARFDNKPQATECSSKQLSIALLQFERITG